MALRVCECAINGQLLPENMRLLAFIIITSEHFAWGDDELLAEVLYDWSCPEVNYPLTPENLVRFKRWLDETEPYPARPATPPPPSGTLTRLIRKQL